MFNVTCLPLLAILLVDAACCLQADGGESKGKAEADKKKAAAAAPGKPAAAPAAAGKKPGGVGGGGEEPALVRSEAEVESDRQRAGEEGLAMCAELWTRLARAALDLGDLRTAQNAACAAVNLIPESTTAREVRACVRACVHLCATPFTTVTGGRSVVVALDCVGGVHVGSSGGLADQPRGTGPTHAGQHILNGSPTRGSSVQVGITDQGPCTCTGNCTVGLSVIAVSGSIVSID